MARISGRAQEDFAARIAPLLPSVAPDLLEHLKHHFRVNIGPGIELRMIDRMVGWQEVINHLELLLASQNQDK
jgi:hypothetical protein